MSSEDVVAEQLICERVLEEDPSHPEFPALCGTKEANARELPTPLPSGRSFAKSNSPRLEDYPDQFPRDHPSQMPS
jgi:hypothetical protein